MSNEKDLRYPIGDFMPPQHISREDRRNAIWTIRQLPEKMREAVRELSPQQLDTPYRDGGWTVRQVVHHVGDSHMTAFHRVRRALTEDWPTVPGYDEKAFAELADRDAPLDWSLDLLEGVHARWVLLLEALTDEQWQRGFMHLERGSSTIDAATPLYAWHSLHHVAHITELRARNDW